MLNPTFPKSMNAYVRAPYVVADTVADGTLRGNESFDTGPEYRLQTVYGNEIWLKLQRAGLTPEVLSRMSVLEVCAGTGFLTFHLLSRCKPKSVTVNDISVTELDAARKLISERLRDSIAQWVLGDMHTVGFERKFDLIIGNSFLHHFYNVPLVLARMQSLLNPGGIFISLHEPTPMSTVIEGAKVMAYPLAVLAPKFVNNIARARYRGEPSATDLWMFEPRKLRRVAKQAGFSSVETCPWLLVRPILVQRNGLHLSDRKQELAESEVQALERAIKMDAALNKVLPQRFFGSVSLVCRK